MSNVHHILLNPHNPIEVVKAAILRELIIDSIIAERIISADAPAERKYFFTHKSPWQGTKCSANSIDVGQTDFLDRLNDGKVFSDITYKKVSELPDYQAWVTILNLTSNYAKFAFMDTPSIAAVMRVNKELSQYLEAGDLMCSFPIQKVLKIYTDVDKRGTNEKPGSYLIRMAALYPSVQSFTRRVMRDAATRMAPRIYHIGSNSMAAAHSSWKIMTINVPSATAYVVARNVLHAHPACVLYEDVGDRRLWRVAARESNVDLPDILRQCIGKQKCSDIFSENGFICMWSDNTNLVATRTDYNLIAS